MTTITIAWIDDTERRSKLLAHLADTSPKGVNVTPIFVLLTKEKAQPKLAKFLQQKRPPTLLVVDQVLNKCEWQMDIPLLGSSLAEIIRQKWPACPIVGVTAGQNINAQSDWYDLEKQAEFEDLIEEERFGRAIEMIYAVAFGFQSLRQVKAFETKVILKFLNAPLGENERLAASIPDRIRTSTSADRSVPRAIATWIRKRLMQRPGFLYDREWTANLLGLTPNGFSKVEHLFEVALYDGVFAEGSNPRWWGIGLKETLFKTVKDLKSNLTWVEGQKLPGLKGTDYSTCYVCKEPHPEIIAFVDTASAQRRPMHIRCTVPDPRFQSLLYFDDIRVMKG